MDQLLIASGTFVSFLVFIALILNHRSRKESNRLKEIIINKFDTFAITKKAVTSKELIAFQDQLHLLLNKFEDYERREKGEG